MKKLVIFQIITVVFILAAFFAVLHITENKLWALAAAGIGIIITFFMVSGMKVFYSNAGFMVFPGFVVVIVAAIGLIPYSAIIGPSATTDVNGTTILVVCMTVMVGFFTAFLAFVVAEHSKMTKVKVITAYLLQLAVIIAATLVC